MNDFPQPECAVEEFDRREFPHMSVVAGRGHIALDLGANLGVYTCALSAAVGTNGRVYSIEPVPDTFQQLSRNIHRLNLLNVTALNVAVSDVDGSVTMVVPRYASGAMNIYEARVITESEDASADAMRTGELRITVPCRTIDSLFSALPDRIAFIKCDGEEHEFNCIAGAQEILSRWHPALLVEIWSDLEKPHGNGERILGYLRALGYAPYFNDGAALRPWCRGRRILNHWFLTPEHVAALDRQGRPVLAE